MQDIFSSETRQALLHHLLGKDQVRARMSLRILSLHGEWIASETLEYLLEQESQTLLELSRYVLPYAEQQEVVATEILRRKDAGLLCALSELSYRGSLSLRNLKTLLMDLGEEGESDGATCLRLRAIGPLVPRVPPAFIRALLHAKSQQIQMNTLKLLMPYCPLELAADLLRLWKNPGSVTIQNLAHRCLLQNGFIEDEVTAWWYSRLEVLLDLGLSTIPEVATNGLYGLIRLDLSPEDSRHCLRMLLQSLGSCNSYRLALMRTMACRIINAPLAIEILEDYSDLLSPTARAVTKFLFPGQHLMTDSSAAGPTTLLKVLPYGSPNL